MNGSVEQLKLICKFSFGLIEPSIDLAMGRGITDLGTGLFKALAKRDQGYMVMLNPWVPWEPKCKGPDDPFFLEEAVLWTHSIGDPEQWEHPFDKHAFAKAYTSWKTGLPSGVVQQEAPYLFEEGMSKHAGSAVRPGGLVGAFSGVEGWLDEMFANWMLDTTIGVCKHEVLKPAGLLLNPDIAFIGDDK